MIGINVTGLSTNHNGGKDQVILNLLKGFEEIGVSSKMKIFCYKVSEKIIKEIIPNAEIILLNERKFLNKKSIDKMIFESFFSEKIYKKYKISKVLYMNENIGFKKFNEIKTIIIPHDIQPVSNPKNSNLNLIYRNYYKVQYFLDFFKADKIIAISEFDKSEMEKYFSIFKKKIQRIYNPIYIYDGDNNNNKEKNIVAINLQHRHKNIITIIKAFELLKDKIEHNLILIGKKNDYVLELEKYVKEKKLEKRIVFTGFLKTQEMYNLLKKSELYINSSLFEGFGMTAVEAMILKVPTIVSNSAAIYEVTKGLANYYKNALDYKELAEMMLKVLNSSHIQSDLNEISKRIILEYDYKEIAKKYYKLLNEI